MTFEDPLLKNEYVFRFTVSQLPYRTCLRRFAKLTDVKVNFRENVAQCDCVSKNTVRFLTLVGIRWLRLWTMKRTNSHFCLVLHFMCLFNHLTGTLKPHTNGPLYSNTVIGTAPPSPLLAKPNATAHPSTASVSTSYYSTWPINRLTRRINCRNCNVCLS